MVLSSLAHKRFNVLPLNLLFFVHFFEQIILVQGQQRRLKILFLADNFLISSISQGFTKNGHYTAHRAVVRSVSSY